MIRAAIAALRRWWRARRDPAPAYPNVYGVRLRPLSPAEHRAYRDALAAAERAPWGSVGRDHRDASARP